MMGYCLLYKAGGGVKGGCEIFFLYNLSIPWLSNIICVYPTKDQLCIVTLERIRQSI